MTQQEQALATMPEAPLITAQKAREQWDEYQQLKTAILQDDDYLFFLEWDETYTDKRGMSRARVRRRAYSSRADCEAAARKRRGSRIRARLIKSACRKMAKFFGLQIPSLGQGHTERLQEGEFIVSIERGDHYTHTEWLHAGTLQTVKASTTVFIVSSSGRQWMGRGGAHQSEGFAEDFAIGQTAFTRAVNRAVLDLVGWGEETGEELRTTEELPGDDSKGPYPEADQGEMPTEDIPFEEPPPPALRDAPPPAKELQQAWDLARQGIAKMGADVRGRTISWLTVTTGKEIPQNIFGRKAPPLDFIPTRLIYLLAERVKSRQLNEEGSDGDKG